MKIYLTRFSTSTAYENATLELPNVSLIEDDMEVRYTPLDYSKEYFTFECLSAGTITITANIASVSKTISYSIDNGSTWTDLTTSITEQSLGTFAIGDKVLIKGNNNFYGSAYYNYFGGTAQTKVYGNIMSLIYGDNFIDQISFPSGSDSNFYNLFYRYNNLIDASNLILPATTLTNNCYYGMFNSCESLIIPPELPATTLANYCYTYMFRGCTSLTTVPELPATTLASYCYNYMFYGTSLATAPELPATTLTNCCYNAMFSGCTNLTTAPELPATTLASYCYYSMFNGCTSLATAPALPATTLADYCYSYMFYGCTSLTTTPELPATTLASYCYYSMFYGCTRLTTAPALPATTLADYCYSYMFRNCTSLTIAPALPATTLASYCYYYMFYGCTSLNYIKAMFTTTPSTSYTDNWVSGVASTGTFVKNSAATWTTTGVNGIPTGWTVETASA